jgi:hypothetical protein
VIALRGRDDPPALGLPTINVVVAREPERRLVRLRPAGDEVRSGEALGRDRDELPRQPFLRGIRQQLVVDVGEPGALLTGCPDEVGASVAERGGHRATAHGIEITVPVDVLEPDALTSNGDRIGVVELGRKEPRLAAADGSVTQADRPSAIRSRLRPIV